MNGHTLMREVNRAEAHLSQACWSTEGGRAWARLASVTVWLLG